MTATLHGRELRDSIPRYTIQQQAASIYFRLIEDPKGAWVTYENHNAIVTRLEDRPLSASAPIGSASEHGWNCSCDACKPLLSFLNSISPSLLNTPKRNADGEAVLSIAKSIAIARADYTALLDEREESASAISGMEQLIAQMRWAHSHATSGTVAGPVGNVEGLVVDARFVAEWADELTSLVAHLKVQK